MNEGERRERAVARVRRNLEVVTDSDARERLERTLSDAEGDVRGRVLICPRCGQECRYDGWEHVHRSGLGIGSCPGWEEDAAEAAYEAKLSRVYCEDSDEPPLLVQQLLADALEFARPGQVVTFTADDRDGGRTATWSVRKAW